MAGRGGELGRVVVLGVGNPMRGDDGVGPAVVAKCRELCGHSEGRLVLIDAGESPEAHLDEVRGLGPDVVVIVDAVDFGGRPGEVALFDLVRDGSSRAMSLPSTHRLPLGLLASYIRKETGAEVVLVGVQPRSIEFGEGMSEEAGRAAEAVARALVGGDLLREIDRRFRGRRREGGGQA